MITITRVNYSPSTGVVLVTFNNGAVVEASDAVLYAIKYQADIQLDFTDIFLGFTLFAKERDPQHFKAVTELTDWQLVFDIEAPAKGAESPPAAI